MDYFEFTWMALLWGVFALVVSFALSTAVLIIVLIRLPAVGHYGRLRVRSQLPAVKDRNGLWPDRVGHCDRLVRRQS